MRRRISNLLIDLGARRAFDLIDRIAYWRRLALTARSNRAFQAAHPAFAAPPLPFATTGSDQPPVTVYS